MPIQAYIIGGLLLASLVGGAIYWTYDEGRDAGSGAVKVEVLTETIETITKAREAKEKADAEVRATPYEGRVDGLR